MFKCKYHVCYAVKHCCFARSMLSSRQYLYNTFILECMYIISNFGSIREILLLSWILRNLYSEPYDYQSGTSLKLSVTVRFLSQSFTFPYTFIHCTGWTRITAMSWLSSNATFKVNYLLDNLNIAITLGHPVLI